MTEATKKRTVEEIVEGFEGSDEATALTIWEIQVGAANFVDQYRDSNKAGRPVDWDVVDYMEIPRDFIELLVKLAGYEVRL